MITHRTFTGVGGVMVTGMKSTQEEVRAQAEAFMASHVDPDDILGITESTLPSTWSKCLVSVTVWYRER